MSNKQFLPLPTSVDNFAELITSSCYYVDKTPYLKEVFADITTADDKSKVKGSNVLLFTRKKCLQISLQQMISLKLKAQTYCSLQDQDVLAKLCS